MSHFFDLFRRILPGNNLYFSLKVARLNRQWNSTINFYAIFIIFFWKKVKFNFCDKWFNKWFLTWSLLWQFSYRNNSNLVIKFIFLKSRWNFTLDIILTLWNYFSEHLLFNFTKKIIKIFNFSFSLYCIFHKEII